MPPTQPTPAARTARPIGLSGPGVLRSCLRRRATAEEDPCPERDEHRGDHHIEGTRAGQELHAYDGAGDDAWDRSDEQNASERATCLLLTPVAIQRPGRGDDVVEQIRRRDRGARRTEHAHLEGQQQDSTRHTDRLASVATTNAATSARRRPTAGLSMGCELSTVGQAAGTPAVL